MDDSRARRAVSALANERPEWLSVLEAAIAVSERVEPFGGEFAGAWVLDELERRSGHRTWLPNLRVLVSYGLLEKAGESTRGGRRAYYRVTAARVIREMLDRLRQIPSNGEAPLLSGRRFRFVAAGDSGEPESDMARGAADVTYEPRSWR